MYLLLKRGTLSGTSVYRIEEESLDISNITKSIQKRVTDGCPINSLKVVEEIPFEFECAVKYGEDLHTPDPDAK